MDEGVREELAASDPRFLALMQQHSEFDRKLHELQERPYRSAEDEMEEARLKKQKLMLKDQMEVRRANWHAASPAPA